VPQNQALLVPLIISPLEIQRSIPRFWSAQNEIPCEQQGIIVKAQHLNRPSQPGNRTDLNPPRCLES